MPSKLSVLTVLLLLACLLLAAANGHAASLGPTLSLAYEEEVEGEGEAGSGEGEEASTECDIAYEEADAGEASEEEAQGVCDEEAAEPQPVAKPRGGKAQNTAERRARQRAKRRKRACHHRARTVKKRQCPRGPRRR
jgi:hypothetical protein